MKLFGNDILYLDNHLLVLSKPAGMSTQPTLEESGKAWLKKRFEKPGKVFLHAVHRLDQPVSGVILCARTSKALSRLNQAQREKRFQKEYLALVEGKMESSQGELEHLLVHETHRARVVPSGGKVCRLKYSVVKCVERYTLLRIKLETGRYHQIRAQFSAIGHPIVGDRKYGSKYDSNTLFLHHSTLCAPHPITRELLTFQAPFPSAWSVFLDAAQCGCETPACLLDMAR